MFRKKATILTLNSLTNVPKVRRLRNSVDSVKSFSFLLQNLSTAAESSEFCHTNGLNNEYYEGYNQNPNVFYRDESHKNHGQGQNWSFRGNNRNFQESMNQFYGKNLSRVHEENPTRVYGKNPDSDEKQHLPVGTNGLLADNNPLNSSNEGFQRNAHAQNGNSGVGYAGEGHRNEFQQSWMRQSSEVGRGNVDNSGKNTYGFQQRPARQNGHTSSAYTREGHTYGFQRGPGGRTKNFDWGNNDVRQNSGGNNTGGLLEDQLNFGGSYQQGAINSRGNYCGANGGVVQPNIDSYNAGMEQNSPNYNAGIAGNLQSWQGNYNDANAGRYPQSLPNSQNYTARSAGNFQPWQANCNEANAGSYQPSFTGASKQNDESAEDDVNIQLKGTIEELDQFSKEGKLELVVQVLGLIEKNGIRVDLPRYLALIKACGEDEALEEAKSIHRHLVRSVPNLDVSSYNSILEMYAKCGSMEDAFKVFDSIPRNFSSWDTMILGLTKNGKAEAAIELFTEYKEQGQNPDGQIYIGVFAACGALHDIIEGMLHFESMRKVYGIVPSMEHYVSVVNMLGISGYLDEALEFIEMMPMDPSVEVWETLMNAARIQGNVEIGDRCAELIELLDPSLLDEQSRAGLIPLKGSDLVKDKQKKKVDGQNPLEIRSRVHEYKAGDRSDPDHEKLYALLWGMKHQMKEAGYIPETKFVLHDVDQESKEEALMGHSERLAVAKGLLNTSARTTMRVIKNLRICGDCHNAMKVISELVGRELIMRDAKRFHHFKDGVCSCRDYW